MGWGQAGEAWMQCAGASFGKLPAGAKLPDVLGGGASNTLRPTLQRCKAQSSPKTAILLPQSGAA